jgi:alpha-ketoglutarate-dependent sulfate ester dioxygenase
MTTVLDSNSTPSTSVTPIGLDIRPIGGALGAEVRGVKLSGDLQPATIKALHQAVLKYKVIFLRDQHHLDDPTQEAFGHLFGDLVGHPTVPSLEGTTAILDVDGLLATFGESVRRSHILRYGSTFLFVTGFDQPSPRLLAH